MFLRSTNPNLIQILKVYWTHIRLQSIDNASLLFMLHSLRKKSGHVYGVHYLFTYLRIYLKKHLQGYIKFKIDFYKLTVVFSNFDTWKINDLEISLNPD